jgi:hypothetical protein
MQLLETPSCCELLFLDRNRFRGLGVSPVWYGLLGTDSDNQVSLYRCLS